MNVGEWVIQTMLECMLKHDCTKEDAHITKPWREKKHYGAIKIFKLEKMAIAYGAALGEVHTLWHAVVDF